jgi:hypothetical protein
MDVETIVTKWIGSTATSSTRLIRPSIYSQARTGILGMIPVLSLTHNSTLSLLLFVISGTKDVEQHNAGKSCLYQNNWHSNCFVNFCKSKNEKRAVRTKDWQI